MEIKDNLITLTEEAVKKALNNEWDDYAFSINLKIIALDNANIPAYTRIAKYYLERENYEYALRVYNKVLLIDPNHIGANNGIRRIEKIEKTNSIIKHLKSHEELYLAGIDFNRANNPKLALECFTRAYNKTPKSQYGISLAKTYRDLGDIDKSESLYRKLLRNDSNNSIIKTGLAATLKDKGSYYESYDLYNSVLAFDQYNKYALNGKGAVCIKLYKEGDLSMLDEALEIFETVRKVADVIFDYKKYLVELRNASKLLNQPEHISRVDRLINLLE